jgi:hypothetical protein
VKLYNEIKAILGSTGKGTSWTDVVNQEAGWGTGGTLLLTKLSDETLM